MESGFDSSWLAVFYYDGKLLNIQVSADMVLNRLRPAPRVLTIFDQNFFQLKLYSDRVLSPDSEYRSQIGAQFGR